MGNEKFCTTAKVTVESKKKTKHHHTTGKRMKARSWLRVTSVCLGTTVVANTSRFTHSKPKIERYNKAAPP